MVSGSRAQGDVGPCSSVQELSPRRSRALGCAPHTGWAAMFSRTRAALRAQAVRSSSRATPGRPPDFDRPGPSPKGKRVGKVPLTRQLGPATWLRRTDRWPPNQAEGTPSAPPEETCQVKLLPSRHEVQAAIRIHPRVLDHLGAIGAQLTDITGSGQPNPSGPPAETPPKPAAAIPPRSPRHDPHPPTRPRQRRGAAHSRHRIRPTAPRWPPHRGNAANSAAATQPCSPGPGPDPPTQSRAPRCRRGAVPGRVRRP